MKRPAELHVRFAVFVAALAAIVYGFRQLVFNHAPMTFNDHLEAMSYGWYVPLFSLYVLWRERRELAFAIDRPSFTGLLAVLPFLAAGFLGTRGIQVRFEILGFVGILISLPWIFFGASLDARLDILRLARRKAHGLRRGVPSLLHAARDISRCGDSSSAPRRHLDGVRALEGIRP